MPDRRQGQLLQHRLGGHAALVKGGLAVRAVLLIIAVLELPQMLIDCTVAALEQVVGLQSVEIVVLE